MACSRRWPRVDGCCVEGEGKAHQRGIELRIPCEDHRGIRSQRLERFVYSWDVRIKGFRAQRVLRVYVDCRGPPVSQYAQAKADRPSASSRSTCGAVLKDGTGWQEKPAASWAGLMNDRSLNFEGNGRSVGTEMNLRSYVF